jgi:hypothetical protein
VSAPVESPPSALARARVPRRFHFIYLRPRSEQLHLAHYLCLESCLRVNQPDRVFLYCRQEPHGEYWERLRERVTLVTVQGAESAPELHYAKRKMNRYRDIHETDFLRLEILLESGGVYADLDTLFVNPFPPELFEHSFVLGREHDRRGDPGEAPSQSLCNAVVIAEPGAAFAQLWLERMPDAFNGTWDAHSTELAEALRAEHPDLVHVEPTRSFYPYLYTRADLAALFEQLHTDLDGVYSIHMWAHLWWSRWRRDFSSFHAGALTERYVRAANATYAYAARPILAAAESAPALAR